jgi:hypothetical protein
MPDSDLEQKYKIGLNTVSYYRKKFGLPPRGTTAKGRKRMARVRSRQARQAWGNAKSRQPADAETMLRVSVGFLDSWFYRLPIQEKIRIVEQEAKRGLS